MRQALRTPLGKMTLALAIVVIGMLVFGGLGYLRITDANSRIDCRAKIAAEFNDKRNKRDDAENTAVNVFLDTALNHRPAGTPLSTDENTTVQHKVDAAVKAQATVDRLPMLNDAVDHGYTLDGVHHGPCRSL